MGINSKHKRTEFVIVSFPEFVE